MAGDPSNKPGCLSLEPTRHCLPRCSGGRPGLPGTRSWRPPHTAMPIAEGYGTLAWRGHSRCPLLPPAEPHRGGAIERLQMLPHTPRGEARRLVPNFEASPHEGFPGDSRETPTPSAALAAPHRPRGSPCLPRRGRCRCPPGARRGAGRAGRALGGGRGIPAAAPAVPGNEATGGGGGGGGSHKPAHPQELPGPRADGAPRGQPRLPPVAHPPRHLPTQAVRAILDTHTHTHTHTHAHGSEVSAAAARDNRQQPSPGCAGGAAAAVGERDTHTRKHTHPRTAGQAEMCISGNLRPHSRSGEGKAQACAPPTPAH